MFFMYESGGEWYVKKDDKGKQWEYGLIAHRGGRKIYDFWQVLPTCFSFMG
jgi:hypothetical protein